MSNDSCSPQSSNNTSPNQQTNTYNNSIDDLTLFGTSTVLLNRSATVKQRPLMKKQDVGGEQVEIIEVKSDRSSPVLGDRYRRSLDSTYRLSLESISEYKPRNSFSTSTSLIPSSSVESSSSDCTDYAIRSATIDSSTKEKTLLSPASSYLSWIESVNSEYFTNTTTSTLDLADVDSKVGEWNNFWLNYNSARSRYLTSPYQSVILSNDDMSDAKSTSSTQREFTEKNSIEQVMLSLDEIGEVLKCSQRITEILQNALKRGEHDLMMDEAKNEASFYSQQNSVVTKEEVVVPRERSFSYVVDAKELQKQKQMLKPPQQSSSSSCINALLNTGVGDILKRVMAKRREVFAPDDLPQSAVGAAATSRASFSDWSTGSNK